MSLFATTVTFTILESHLGTKAPDKTRTIASVGDDVETNKKLELLGAKNKLVKFKHTTKLSGPINLKLESDQGYTAIPGENFSLKAIIEVSQPLQKVIVNWTFPEELELVSGAMETVLFNVDPETPQVIEVILNSPDIENRKVHVSAAAKSGATEFSSVAQFNTAHEQYIKDEKNALLQRNLEYSPDKGINKVFQ